jgi:hypothetical protein
MNKAKFRDIAASAVKFQSRVASSRGLTTSCQLNCLGAANTSLSMPSTMLW